MPSPLPWRLEPCQLDQGETTLIVAANGFTVARINSPAWDHRATLMYPHDRCNAELIVSACNHHDLVLTTLQAVMNDARGHGAERRNPRLYNLIRSAVLTVGAI